MEVGESKMSLGYARGNTWVRDTVYESWTEDETYKALIPACRAAGIMFDCQYSYTARRYTAEIVSFEKIGERWYKVQHNNAYSSHPMEAIAKAIRAYDHGSPLLAVLCVELECKMIARKLLPMKKLGDALQGLADTITVGMLKR